MSFPLLPSRQIECVSALDEHQIGEILHASVLTGFSFFDLKPYYGSFSTYTFSVRRTRGWLKKQSLAPTVEGSYGWRDGRMWVAISMQPHPVFIGIFAFFFLPLALFPALMIPEVLRTRQYDALAAPLVMAAVVYGIMWVIFQVQSIADVRFWKQALRLQEVPGFDQ